MKVRIRYDGNYYFVLWSPQDNYEGRIMGYEIKKFEPIYNLALISGHKIGKFLNNSFWCEIDPDYNFVRFCD